jgi:Domain of unknown function (DUF4340)
MNESGRTVTYVIVAAVAVGLALLLSPPKDITPEELRAANLGQEFYAEFTDPNVATSIRVVDFDETKASPRAFGVSFENGKWTIPSHHNYPADGADRLAKTAASALHIKREELASSSKQYHEQLGVLDPLDEDKTKLKGHGQRITIKKGDDTLVDLIIGKAAPNRSGFFFVRKPNEDSTYVARLNLNLSTKFSDWVETDLLKVNRDDLTEIVQDNYSIDRRRGALIPGDINTLRREKPADPWKLDGLDETKEEVDVAKVNAMIGALDDLKLAGVRPKPKGLKPDLTFDEQEVDNDLEKQVLLLDLQRRGFIRAPDPKTRKQHLFSNEGELIAATNKGVAYTLKFGDVFLGDEAEIEVGASKEAEAEKEGADAEGKAKAAPGKQPSRYLFVVARFDEKYLGERPVEPAAFDESGTATPPLVRPKDNADKPEAGDAADKPATEKQNDAKKPGGADDNCTPAPFADDDPQGAAGDQADTDDKQPPDEKAPPAADKAGDKAPAANEKSAEDLKKELLEKAKKDHEEKVKKYKADLKTFEDKVAAGKKQVDELNARFGAWYYVISAENFNKLHVSRKDLIKEKGKSGNEKNPNDPPIRSDEPPDDEKDADNK